MSPIWRVCLVLAAAAAVTAACVIDNPDHCANQQQPGNEWCERRDAALPYCSPCEAENNGCVQYEPFTCDAYDPAVQDGEPETMGD